MSASLLLFVSVAFAPRPEPGLPARVLTLPVVPDYMRIEGDHLYISGFHARKLVAMARSGKKPAQELPLDSFEHYWDDPLQGEVREVRRAAGGDLALANGKIFVGQVFQGSVLVVDRGTMTPVKRLSIGGQGDFVASRDGRTLYCASNLEREFYIIDTKSYSVRTVAYPRGGRGIGAVALAPDGKRLYLGIQRGGRAPDGKPHSGGNAFLAVYDLEKNEYAGTVYLAEIRASGSSDDSIPAALEFSPKGDRLYVGMSQSRLGVRVIDTKKLTVIRDIRFPPRKPKSFFLWSDPTGLAVCDRWLLVVVRHENEVAVVERASNKVVARIPFDEATKPRKVLVRDGLIHIFGGSKKLTLVKQKDLVRRLADLDPKRATPLSLSLSIR